MFRLMLIVLLFQSDFAHIFHLNGKTYRTDKFLDRCETDKNIYNMTITRLDNTGTGLSFDFDFFLFETQHEPVTVEILVERCPSKEVLDSCRMLRVLKSNKVCMILHAKKQHWTPLVECWNPSLSCPLSIKNSFNFPIVSTNGKGKYHGINCTVDLEAVAIYFPIGRYYWKIKTIFYSQLGEKIYCDTIQGQRIKNF